MSSSTPIEIFVGTYDSYLLSYKLCIQNGRTFLERFISQDTHTGSVRCVSGHGRYLATGGSDDRIIVMDLKKNQEIQMLTHHSGTINQLEFSPDGKFLFSASDDGSLAATKIGSWITDNVWRTPHSGKPIIYFAIHPTGKLALTLGKDGTLRTWSLIKGRQVFTTNLKTLTPNGGTIERVIWSPNGAQFALISVDKVLIMSVGSGGIVREFVGKSRTTCLCWLDDDRLALGQMDGKIRFVSLEDEEEEEASAITVDAHDCRIKDMALIGNTLVTLGSHGTEGHITVWHLDTDELTLTEICGTTLNRRPICMALVDATLYRPVPYVKPEPGEPVLTKNRAPRPEGRKMDTAGRVTIENDEDDLDNEDAAMSLFQATAPKKPKTSKKRSISVVQHEEDEQDDLNDEIVQTPTIKKKNKKSKKTSKLDDSSPETKTLESPTTVSEKKSKMKSSLVTTITADETKPVVSAKKLKKSGFTITSVEDTTTSPLPAKKPKKASKRNDDSIQNQSLMVEKQKKKHSAENEFRRKSSKW